ncbi:hypothetical protein FQR65_LT04876 [Abscondita terminalis]|nr:hypothetical protein FQR65_LT04876 [Abscondita terminalis]
MDGDYNIIDNIIYTPDIKHRPDERGIGWVYYEEMLKRKDMVAQIDGLTGEKENFGSLLQRCVTVAVGLKAQGVRKFDKGGSVVFMSDTPYWNVFFYTLNYSIKTGTARMVYPKFDFSDPWKVFSQKISTVFLNLTELMTLCNTPKPKEIDISGLELISTAGSPVSINHIAIAKECFPNVLLRIPYGQSEVFMSMTYFNMTIPRHVELMKRKVNSCGLPRPGITFKFVDEGSGKALGPNAKGELRVKTDMQMSGYYNMDSSDAWDEDGWLKTGDYGYYDDDCCFYIIDRVKEMFTYRSWHILPAVLESILITHPAVFRAVVIGVPHDIDEHHPMAIVQLNPDAKVTDAELVKYMEDKVEDRQRLRGGVKFVDEFPLTPSQKINRRILKEMVLQGNI